MSSFLKFLSLLWPWLRRPLSNIFGLDIRSLALLRIGLALIVLCDVYIRYQDLRAHYSDEGVMPRLFLPPGNAPISIHLLDGSVTYQAFLFYFEGLAALALLVGWQTRLATAIVWFLVISLHARNPLVFHGGDKVLRLLLFWSIFLPLGACYSVDSLSRPNPPRRVFTLATVALLIQICFVYWSAALMKYDAVWRTEGYAVYMSLSVGHFTTRLGQWMLNFPWILSIMTTSTLIIEGLVPFLIFIPWRTGLFRLLVIVSFVMFHIGLGLCMELGNFPWVCSVAWLALLPTEFWDWAAKRLQRPARQGLKLAFDRDSGPAFEGVRFWTTVLALRDVEVIEAQAQPELLDRERWEGTWFAVNAQNQPFTGTDGLRLLVSASPLFWPLAGLLGGPRSRGLGDWLAGVRRDRAAGDIDPPARPDRPALVRPLSGLTNLVIGFLLVYIIAWNIGAWDEPHSPDNNMVLTGMLHVRDFVQEHFLPQNMVLGWTLALDQNWALFGPRPATIHGWFVIVGTLRNGQKVDLLTYTLHKQGAEPTWDRPDHIGEAFPNSSWRKYFVNLIGLTPNQYTHRHLFAIYMTNVWNADHPDPAEQLLTIDTYLMEETTQKDYQPFKREKVRLCHTDCIKMESQLEPVRNSP